MEYLGSEHRVSGEDTLDESAARCGLRHILSIFYTVPYPGFGSDCKDRTCLSSGESVEGVIVIE